ncbi:hypothetical protein BJY04DRAFT_222536 [Aspergillus karnatakaensis]|uniref:uncharacterized protein n=1 Tax=Aspergillus karnatakaensis TaxID=1810916 RepID=UPI003CCD0FBF
MKVSHIASRLVLVACSVALGTFARECETTSESDPASNEKTLHVSSPDQLIAFEGCTSITGHILILPEFSGEFILNGVTDFAGNISTPVPESSYWWRPPNEFWTPEDYTPPDITRFELQDLVHVENIVLYGLKGDAILPNLESSGDVVLVQDSDGAEVDLGKLVGAENVKVQGSWTTINVSSLKKVNDEAQFCGSRGCGIYPDDDFPTLTVDLPALETAGRFEVAGTVASVSVPELQVLSRALRINIQEGGEELDFDAPKLHSLGGSLEVYGGVSRVSLGALGDTTVSATINARADLDFYSTIKTASNFYVWGTLHSIYLPGMADLGSVSLDYEPVIPCNETLYRLYEAQGSTGSNDPAICTRPDEPEDQEHNGDSGSTPDVSETPDDEDSDDHDDNSNEDTSDDTTNEDSITDDTADDDTTFESSPSDDNPGDTGENGNTTTAGGSDEETESSTNSSDTGSDDTASANGDDSYIPEDGAYQSARLPSLMALVVGMIGVLFAFL